MAAVVGRTKLPAPARMKEFILSGWRMTSVGRAGGSSFYFGESNRHVEKSKEHWAWGMGEDEG